MTDSSTPGASPSDPQPIPAGLQPAPAVPVNGHGSPVPPTAAQQTAGAAAAIAGMLRNFPGTLVQVLAQVPVMTRQHMCAHCLGARLGWAAQHQAELKTATETAAQAAGIDPAGPYPPNLDPAPFLPEHLRPGGPQGIPAVQQALTTVGGTEVCPAHLPGQPAGRQPLLIAHGALTQSMLGQLGG